MSTVWPEIETGAPNWSFSAPSDAISLAVWVHVVPLFSNTHTEPELDPSSSSYRAPTTTVLLEIEAEYPNLSLWIRMDIYGLYAH